MIERSWVSNPAGCMALSIASLTGPSKKDNFIDFTHKKWKPGAKRAKKSTDWVKKELSETKPTIFWVCF